MKVTDFYKGTVMYKKIMMGLLTCVSLAGLTGTAQATLIQDNLADNLYIASTADQ